LLQWRLAGEPEDPVAVLRKRRLASERQDSLNDSFQTAGGSPDGMQSASSRFSMSGTGSVNMAADYIVAEACLAELAPLDSKCGIGSSSGSMQRIPLLRPDSSGRASYPSESKGSGRRQVRNSSPPVAKRTSSDTRGVATEVTVAVAIDQKRQAQSSNIVAIEAPDFEPAPRAREPKQEAPAAATAGNDEMRQQLLEAVRRNDALQRRNEELERRDVEHERQKVDLEKERSYVLQRLYSGPPPDVVDMLGTVPSNPSMTTAPLLLPGGTAPSRPIRVPSLHISSSMQAFGSDRFGSSPTAGVDMVNLSTPRPVDGSSRYVTPSGPAPGVARMVSARLGAVSPSELLMGPASPMVVPRMLSSPHLIGSPGVTPSALRPNVAGNGYAGPSPPQRMRSVPQRMQSAPMSAFGSTDEGFPAYGGSVIATASSAASASAARSSVAMPGRGMAVMAPMSWHRQSSTGSAAVASADLGRRAVSPINGPQERSPSVSLGHATGYSNLHAQTPASPPAPPQRMISSNMFVEDYLAPAGMQIQCSARFPSPPPAQPRSPVMRSSSNGHSPRDSAAQVYSDIDLRNAATRFGENVRAQVITHSQSASGREPNMRHWLPGAMTFAPLHPAMPSVIAPVASPAQIAVTRGNGSLGGASFLSHAKLRNSDGALPATNASKATSLMYANTDTGGSTWAH